MTNCTASVCSCERSLRKKLICSDLLYLTSEKQHETSYHILASHYPSELLHFKLNLLFRCAVCKTSFWVERLKFLDVFQACPVKEARNQEQLQVSENICFHIQRTLQLFREDPYLETFHSLIFESDIVPTLAFQLYVFFYQRFVKFRVKHKNWIFTLACKNCSSFVQENITLE